jgi:uncharacterized protein (DUF1501 family)
MKRRELLKNGVTLFTAGFAAPPLLARMASAQGSVDPGRDNILVMVLLNGGNDGVNTVVPYTDGSYYAKRPTIQLAGSKTDAETRLPLISNSLAFHPAMGRFKALYDAGQLAVIQGVGYPNPDGSHERSMDIWQTAAPDRIEQLGWLGKYMDVAQSTERRALFALNVGREQPRALLAERSLSPSVVDLAEYIYQTNPRVPANRTPQIAALKRINSHVPIDRPYVGLIQKTAFDAYDTSERLQAAKNYRATVTYPNNGLGQGLKLIAQVIMQNLGTKIFFVEIGGFDTHANQIAEHNRLLSAVSNSIGAFHQDLKNQGRDRNVLIVTFSEFGRPVKENGSQGTDHGEAAPMFVIGGATKGGVYGPNPNLSTTNGNVPYSIDFRAVYSTVLQRWLGTNPATVLANPFPLVDFL